MKVHLLSPSRPLAEVEATSVSIPGDVGMIEVLDNHAPMVSKIDCGPLTIKKPSGEHLHFFVAGGYTFIEGNTVKVLVSVGESSDEIDPQRAQSALGRAQDRLKKLSPDVDLSRALFAQKRAVGRIAMSQNG